MEKANQRTARFLQKNSRFARDSSFFLVLREWNSYTPVIPAEGEPDRGGGYYIRHGNEGVVIDPGYDFLGNFHAAGGRLCDIDHIILTHAHDDHTAEFEALLMLLHRYNKENPGHYKRVNLYLSAGAQRKFTGLFGLRDQRFRRVLTLCSSKKGMQSVSLNNDMTLTVLPAYHDDVLTKDMSIGLGFKLETPKGTRRIVFTGDTGLYPRREDESGKPQYYDLKTNNRPELDVTEDTALYNNYPEEFREPDLLVAHIGSIQKNEFDTPGLTPDKKPGEWYYTNHLGVLGTLTMLDQLQPKVAVISEFGAELKGFHIELVNKIGEALYERQNAMKKPEATLVIPGDRTIIYEITEHKLLCHDDAAFADPQELVCRPCRGYDSEFDEGAREYNAIGRKDSTERAYLFLKERSSAQSDGGYTTMDSRVTADYFKKFFNHRLPFHIAED